MHRFYLDWLNRLGWTDRWADLWYRVKRLIYCWSIGGWSGTVWLIYTKKAGWSGWCLQKSAELADQPCCRNTVTVFRHPAFSYRSATQGGQLQFSHLDQSILGWYLSRTVDWSGWSTSRVKSRLTWLISKCWLISLVYYRILTYTKGDQSTFRVDQPHRENNSRSAIIRAASTWLISRHLR